MKPKRLSVLVCNHGLGHLKRILWVIDTLFKYHSTKWAFDIYVDCEKLKYFSSKIQSLKRTITSLSFFDIRAQSNQYENELLDKYKSEWQITDYIWSDNFIFPLKYRDDVFLTGSFLWPEVFNVQTDKNAKDIDLLNKKRPIMIGNKYFMTPMVKKLTNFSGVGMYEYFAVDHIINQKKGILICCGKSGADLLRSSLANLQEEIKSLPADIDVYFDSEFYSFFSHSNNAKKGDFTELMFAQISSAVIRPGLGTICDVLSKSGRVFSFREEDNFEMLHNEKVLRELGVGEPCDDIIAGFRGAVNYIQNVESQDKHLSHIKTIDFNGLALTAQKINEILN